MDKTTRWFLVFLFVLVAAGAILILLIPGAMGGDGGAPNWVLAVLGGIAAVGGICAWRVRPDRHS